MVHRRRRRRTRGGTRGRRRACEVKSNGGGGSDRIEFVSTSNRDSRARAEGELRPAAAWREEKKWPTR
jgi:hypothetical protein